MLATPLLTLVTTIAAALSFPGAQPQLGGAGRRVGLVFGRDGVAYFAASQDAGRSFSEPQILPGTSGLHLGGRRGPRVAVVDGVFVVTAIVGRGRNAGDLLAWRSLDEGRTWSGPKRLNRVDASAREGLHGMAAAGNLVAVSWLDLRASDTRVYAAVSRDRGQTWSEDFVAYEAPPIGACECCHPSVAVSAEGELAILFRNHVAGARDLYLVRAARDGRSFAPAAKLGRGSWTLEACPMDGGGIAFDRKGQPVSAWRRDKDVFLAWPEAAEVRLGEGRDPAIAVAKDGSTHVAWRRGEGLVMAAGAKESLGSSAGITMLAARGTSPVLLSLDDGSLLAAWQEDDQVRVKPLRSQQ